MTPLPVALRSARGVALVSALSIAATATATTSRTSPRADTVAVATRIGARELGSALPEGARFGSAVAALGDLNGDGVSDVAVGAFADDGDGNRRGAIWIVFLRKDGTVRSARRISAGESGFVGPLADHDRFGSGLALVGDLDGDGRPELAVGAPGDGAESQGAVWILSLEKDGSVSSERKIAPGLSGFDEALATGDFFGFALAGPGDLDGDGIRDLVVGAPYAERANGGHGSVWMLRLTAHGKVRSSRRIDGLAESPSSRRSPDLFGAFGYDVSSAGDLDGDGRAELAIGAPRGGTARNGSVWIVFLDKEARVRRRVRIAQNEGGFGGELALGASFGTGLASCSDIDGDGVPDLAVGAPTAGVESEGEVWLLLLRPDGTVRAQERLGRDTLAITAALDAHDGFGQSITSLGDLDLDGRPDIVVGAWNAGDGGAVWNLFLGGCFGSSVTIRDGLGLNPRTLSTQSPARAGLPWEVELDCEGHAPGLAVVVGSSSASSGVITSAGELLIDASPGRRVFTIVTSHAGDVQTLGTTLPRDVSFCNYAIYVQGKCTGAPGPTLSNALDLVLGR